MGFFDEKIFLGNLGFGLESIFIKNYNEKGLHGFFAYCIALFKSIKGFIYPKFKIEWQLNEMVLRPLVLLISNLNQQGYNFTVTPKAKTDDGLLDVVIIENLSNFKNIKSIFKIIFGLKFTVNSFLLLIVK